MQLTVDIPDSVDLFGLEGGLWIEAIRKVRTFAAFPEGDGYMRRHTLGVCVHGFSCRQSTTWGVTLRTIFTCVKVDIFGACRVHDSV